MPDRLRRSIQSFFQVSRGESNAFLILIPLMLGILFSEYLFRQWWFSRPHDFTSDRQLLDSLLRQWPADSTVAVSRQPIPFNPNNVTAAFLISIGLQKNLADRVVNYRTGGGIFRVKSDVLKIYNMDTAWFARHKKWMLLPDSLPRPVKKRMEVRQSLPPAIADINQADSIGLLAVRGIGPVYAGRILKFRRALGGFYSMEQLAEVYKIDTAALRELQRRFRVGPDFEPARISVNQADENTLARHPYISRPQAKAIVAYRFQHGAFQSLDDLKKIHLISAADWQRIIPYLEL